MIHMLIVLFALIVILYGYIIFNYDSGPNRIGLALFVCIMLSVISGALIAIKIDSSEPTAMDVYRGNTTLEITYRDSIPVDSVVVFKK